MIDSVVTKPNLIRDGRVLWPIDAISLAASEINEMAIPLGEMIYKNGNGGRRMRGSRLRHPH
jgi:hypothetical protein